MKLATAVVLGTVLAFSGCNETRSKSSAGPAGGNNETSSARPASENVELDATLRREVGAEGALSAAVTTTVGGRAVQSDLQADLGTIQAATHADDRKIIRNAELSLEIDSAAEGQRKITSIAEILGGFIVSSDSRQGAGAGQSKPNQVVTLVARVPAAQFNRALEGIRNVGQRVVQEKVTGQDVTEEFIDLEARIRTKKALEAQFLEIMKQARKVSDALEVQNEIANVRTEIERLEGRRRFLQNQSSYSTITVTLQPAAPLVTATTAGFGHDIKQAFGDGVDVAASIVTGLIRLIIVLVPVAVLILLPMGLVIRFFVRRYRAAGKVELVPEPR
ncbi:MAG TPA: DUF4349 domain-containing protein [Blastocatellia bacterium]|nr:DUF4349 domain-containing protein [Blastocatellia bacterium]